MDAERAIEIIKSLVDGVDPYSGERFPSGSPYQQADTVRALHLALEGLTKLRRSTARKTGPGRSWTEDEEEIAAKHERTKGAIWARLEKLGRIQRKDFPGSTPHPPTSDNASFASTLRPASPSGGDDDNIPF